MMEGGKSKFKQFTLLSAICWNTSMNLHTVFMSLYIIYFMFKMPSMGKKLTFFCILHCLCLATRDCCVQINAPALHCTVHTVSELRLCSWKTRVRAVLCPCSTIGHQNHTCTQNKQILQLMVSLGQADLPLEREDLEAVSFCYCAATFHVYKFSLF